MNYANPSIDYRPPSNKSLPALMLMLALSVVSLLSLTSCGTPKQTLRTRTASNLRKTLTQSDTESFVNHTIVFDTIHVISNETIWRDPDTLGRLYPLKTIRKESGAQRQTFTDKVIQKHDTIYVSTSGNSLSTTDNQIRSPTNTWVPWLIIIGMVIVSIIILAIRLFLTKL